MIFYYVYLWLPLALVAPLTNYIEGSGFISVIVLGLVWAIVLVEATIYATIINKIYLKVKMKK